MQASSVDDRPRRFFPPSQQTRTISLTLGLLLFAGSTLLTLSQDSWTDPQSAPTGWQWWLKPRNPPTELTQIGAHLRAVWALPDNQHIWVGGDYAMLLCRVRKVARAVSRGCVGLESQLALFARNAGRYPLQPIPHDSRVQSRLCCDDYGRTTTRYALPELIAPTHPQALGSF
jgi:hypothetical protein